MSATTAERRRRRDHLKLEMIDQQLLSALRATTWRLLMEELITLPGKISSPKIEE